MLRGGNVLQSRTAAAPMRPEVGRDRMRELPRIVGKSTGDGSVVKLRFTAVRTMDVRRTNQCGRCHLLYRLPVLPGSKSSSEGRPPRRAARNRQVLGHVKTGK